MKILLTGSRDWAKRGPVEAAMLGMRVLYPGAEFVFGDCPTGLDAIALKICDDLMFDHKVFHADWATYGKPAGPRRNGEMVAYCLEDPQHIAYGFRTNGASRGTDDCLEQALQGGMPTYVTRQLPPPI